MDNELEQKRKEKIEGFKISFDGFDDIPDVPDVPEETEEPASQENEDIDIKSDDGLGDLNGYDDMPQELTSYSDEAYADQELNKSELRAAKRSDKKRRRRKAKKNRVIFRVICSRIVVLSVHRA